MERMSNRTDEKATDTYTGTAGLSSAMQLVSSTSSLSFNFGTAPMPLFVSPIEKKQIQRRDDTFNETLRQVIKKHRDTLDKLAEF